jgi:replicative DNA helicase
MQALTNVDAEQTVLACCQYPETVHRVRPHLEPSDFSLEANRILYHTICDLVDAGKPTDELTLSNELGARGQLERIGGAAYVCGLSRKVDQGLAFVTNIEHYAEVVREKSRRRQIRAAATKTIEAADDISTPTEECAGQLQDALLRIEAASGKTSAARHAKEFMPEVFRDLENQSTHQGLVGMPTVSRALDCATGGIRPGELWTAGGLPGKGKTAIGVGFALVNGAAGNPVLFHSLEMQEFEIGKRFLAAKGTLPAFQIRNPQSIKRDRWPELAETAAELSAMPIYVDARGSIKIQELLATARLYIRRHGVKLIIVDYLRLVDAPGRDLRDRVGYVANALRQLAKNERVGVVLLSQLRRPEGGMNARPTMLDLKESGDIEAHSHVVLLPFLPLADDGKPLPEEQLLIIGKNRNGCTGALPVYFDEKRLQFVDRTNGGCE